MIVIPKYITLNSHGRRRVLCKHSPRSTASEQNIQQYTAVAGQLYNSAAAARWFWSRYSKNHNEYALSLLKELGSSNIRNAKHVAIIQNAAIYY